MRSGWKYSSWSSFSPTDDELDRLAGDRLDRERRAAARVAVELRQDDAVERDPLLERLARRRRPPGRSSRRARAGRSSASPRRGSAASSSISASSTCRRPAVSTMTTSRPCALAPARAPARTAATGSLALRAVDRDLDLLAELLELVDRGRALEVGGDERRACVPSLRRSSASLAAVVVLPEPWRPASRITVGGRPAKASCESPAPISAVSSSWTIFTTCWPGVRLFSTSCAERALAHAARRSP